MGQLQDRIVRDLAMAIAGRDDVTKEYLKVVVAELSRGKLQIKTDEEVIDVLKSMKKQANLLTEMSGISFHETKLLDLYLPQMMSEQGVRDYVGLIIETEHLTDIKDLGKVMAHIRNGGLGDQIDNKLASQFAKEILSK
jgi:uncharacterized protein YqeY